MIYKKIYTLSILLFSLTLTACIPPTTKVIQAYSAEKVDIKEIDVFALRPKKSKMTYKFLGQKPFDLRLTEKFKQIGVKANVGYYDQAGFKFPKTGNYRLAISFERATIQNFSPTSQTFRSILLGANNNQKLLSFSATSGNPFDQIDSIADVIVNTIKSDVLK